MSIGHRRHRFSTFITKLKFFWWTDPRPNWTKGPFLLLFSFVWIEGHGPLFYCKWMKSIVLFCSVYCKMAPTSNFVARTDGWTDKGKSECFPSESGGINIDVPWMISSVHLKVPDSLSWHVWISYSLPSIWYINGTHIVHEHIRKDHSIKLIYIIYIILLHK